MTRRRQNQKSRSHNSRNRNHRSRKRPNRNHPNRKRPNRNSRRQVPHLAIETNWRAGWMPVSKRPKRLPSIVRWDFCHFRAVGVALAQELSIISVLNACAGRYWNATGKQKKIQIVKVLVRRRSRPGPTRTLGLQASVVVASAVAVRAEVSKGESIVYTAPFTLVVAQLIGIVTQG